MMTLIPDWKLVLKKAWSVWFMWAAALFSGLETAVSIAGPAVEATNVIPKGLFAAIALVCSGFGVFFRLLAQKKLDEARAALGLQP